MPQSQLQRIYQFLSQNKIQILSTSVANAPISRPIGSAQLIAGRIYYIMNNNKAMFAQMQDNPNICICVCAADYAWIRISARAVFTQDSSIKQYYIDNNLTRFKSADDKHFSVFYLSHITAEIHKGAEVEVIEIK